MSLSIADAIPEQSTQPSILTLSSEQMSPLAEKNLHAARTHAQDIWQTY